MPCALALDLLGQNIQETSPGQWDVVATVHVHYCDANGALFASGPLNINFPTTSTPQQMKTAMSDAIIAEAAVLGLTIAANDIILPDLQRG